MAIETEAYVVKEPSGPITLENVAYDKVGDHEILVENAAFSVCASDLKAAKGVFHLKPPMILGHEAAGTIKQVGTLVHNLKPGDKVILSYDSCHTCRMCNTGQNAYCTSIPTLNFSGHRSDNSTAATDSSGQALKSFFFGQSSMGRLSLAHASCAVKVECTDEELELFAALGCGIQTGSGAIFNVCRPPPGCSIAIFGAGAVGLSAAYAARLTAPAKVVLVDNAKAKLEMIPEGVATATIDSGLFAQEGELTKELMRISKGEGFDFVIDCAGVASLVSEGHQALAPRGMMVTVGGGPQFAKIALNKQLLAGATYRGTHQGDSVPSVALPMLIKLWRQGNFPFEQLLTFYEFDELDKALADLRDGKVFKPVLRVRRH